MKKIPVFLVLLAFMLVVLTSCYERNVFIQYDSQTNETIIVKDDETFNLSKYEMESKLFLGCYSSNSEDKKLYVDCNGKSIPWKEEYPSRLVAKYADLPLNVTSTQSAEFSIGYAGSKTVNFDFDQAYTNYAKNNPNSKFEVSVKFSHYEQKTNILGIGASNWSECRIFIGSATNIKSTDYLESNSGYKEFSKSYTVSGSEFGTFSLGISLTRPVQNVSTQQSLYKNFVVTISEISGGTSTSTAKTEYVLNVQSDATLKPAIESSITRTVEIPDEIYNAARVYADKSVKIEISYENFGAKDITGIFDNWGMLKFIFKASDTTLIQREVVMQHNDDYKFDKESFSMTNENFLRLKKIDLNFWYDNPSTFAGNHSGNWYYVRNISVKISFV